MSIKSDRRRSCTAHKIHSVPNRPKLPLTFTALTRAAFTFIIFMFMLSSCIRSTTLDLKRAERESQSGSTVEAVQRCQRILAKEPRSTAGLKAARLGARLALLDLKDARLAITFYRHLIMYSPDNEERRNAQITIAQTYYENLNDYRSAIAEYSKLVSMARDPNEEFHFRMPLAKSYYFLNNYVQARAELKTLLSKDVLANVRFDIFLLLANISMTLKKLDDAAEAFRKLLNEYPERARKESVALNLVMVLEEQKKYAEAIEILVSIRNNSNNVDFIDLRIKRFNERLAQLPGAKGLRK